MGDFSGCPNWKLVNDFTIHEDKNLRDRPLMRTCVPQILDVEVTSFEIVRRVVWPDTPNKEDEPRPITYVDRSYVRFNGRFHDTINVFDMSAGEIAIFKTLTDATIHSLPAGSIGGKHKATSLDGISYSGMSSRNVPDDGLMAGEPGQLTFLTEFEEHPRRAKTEAHLSATLYLDEDKFLSLLSVLSEKSRHVSTFSLRILAELFESEVSASLSENWMARDYGLLMKGKGFTHTSARIETVSISTGVTRLDRDVEAEDDNLRKTDRASESDERPPTIDLTDQSSIHLKYQRYILIAVIVLIAVTAFSH